jgi:hypothetical protein
VYSVEADECEHNKYRRGGKGCIITADAHKQAKLYDMIKRSFDAVTNTAGGVLSVSTKERREHIIRSKVHNF